MSAVFAFGANQSMYDAVPDGNQMEFQGDALIHQKHFGGSALRCLFHRTYADPVEIGRRRIERPSSPSSKFVLRRHSVSSTATAIWAVSPVDELEWSLTKCGTLIGSWLKAEASFIALA
jgi:hypothetical protein